MPAAKQPESSKLNASEALDESGIASQLLMPEEGIDDEERTAADGDEERQVQNISEEQHASELTETVARGLDAMQRRKQVLLEKVGGRRWSQQPIQGSRSR